MRGKDAGELPYDVWTEEAMKAVVASALEHTARNGLIGEHHYFISFRTDAPGVSIPRYLRAKHPTEMTVVLQHVFGNLAVDLAAGRFSVDLSFGGVLGTIRVPFAALTSFVDPHAKFGLRFERTANATRPASVGAPEAPPAAAHEPGGVVSLEAFRSRRAGA